MTPWFKRRPELLKQEERGVASAYPSLYFVVGADTVRVRGSLSVCAGPVAVDRFQIEVLLARDHPTGFPIAWEIEGRVPWLLVYHVNADGQLCLFLPEEGSDYWPPGSTVLSFLQGPLNSFFVGFLHYQKFGSWPFGEWRHGLDGTFDFYRQRTGISEADGLLETIRLLARGGIKGHWECPCGARQRIRSCHPGVLALREAVSPTVASSTLQRIVEEARRVGNSEDLQAPALP